MTTTTRIHHIKELFPFHSWPHIILGVFAHPDDESLLAGGMFALAHDEGIHSLLVTATRGERGGKFSGLYGKKLALTRTHELVRATSILKIPTVYQLQIPDKGVNKARLEVMQTLIDILITHTPQIIVTHDLLDTSQHPDHIATAHAVIDAVKHINSRWKHVVLFAALTPHQDRLSYALDIDAYRDTKIQACRTHRSQGLFRGTRLPVPIDIYYAVNHFEYFMLYEKETAANA